MNMSKSQVYTSQNAITEGDFIIILARNCEGTEQLLKRIKYSEKFFLIDGHSILNRAYYGLPNLTNWGGLHTMLCTDF